MSLSKRAAFKKKLTQRRRQAQHPKDMLKDGLEQKKRMKSVEEGQKVLEKNRQQLQSLGKVLSNHLDTVNRYLVYWPETYATYLDSVGKHAGKLKTLHNLPELDKWTKWVWKIGSSLMEIADKMPGTTQELEKVQAKMADLAEYNQKVLQSFGDVPEIAETVRATQETLDSMSEALKEGGQLQKAASTEQVKVVTSYLHRISIGGVLYRYIGDANQALAYQQSQSPSWDKEACERRWEAYGGDWDDCVRAAKDWADDPEGYCANLKDCAEGTEWRHEPRKKRSKKKRSRSCGPSPSPIDF